LLLNNARIDYETSKVDPEVLQYTSYHWIPVQSNPDLAQTSTFTIEKNKLIKPISEYSRILGIKNPEVDFFSISDTVKTSPYRK